MAFPGALPRRRRLARRASVLHGNQPHLSRGLHASMRAAQEHTYCPLPGSRSTAQTPKVPPRSANPDRNSPDLAYSRPRECLAILAIVTRLCTLIAISISSFFESFVTSTRSLLAAITQPIVKNRAVGRRYSVKPGPWRITINPPPNASSRFISDTTLQFLSNLLAVAPQYVVAPPSQRS